MHVTSARWDHQSKVLAGRGATLESRRDSRCQPNGCSGKQRSARNYLGCARQKVPNPESGCGRIPGAHARLCVYPVNPHDPWSRERLQFPRRFLIFDCSTRTKANRRSLLPRFVISRPPHLEEVPGHSPPLRPEKAPAPGAMVGLKGKKCSSTSKTVAAITNHTPSGIIH
jgi:hypothetical protein